MAKAAVKRAGATAPGVAAKVVALVAVAVAAMEAAEMAGVAGAAAAVERGTQVATPLQLVW